MKYTTKFTERVFKSKDEMVEAYTKHINAQERLIASNGKFSDYAKRVLDVLKQELQERLKEFD